MFGFEIDSKIILTNCFIDTYPSNKSFSINSGVQRPL